MLIDMNTKLITPQPFMLILYGPTGVGKTDVALSIASHIPAEIINMDVGQFYTPFSIGTAKPDWQNEPTPHHLFDIIDDKRNYTVVEYRAAVNAKITEIIKRGNLPIIVGGSSFYLYSLLFPPREEHVSQSENSVIDENSWELLHSIDPQRAEKIGKTDPYRIARALDIWKQTGKVPGSLHPTYDPIAHFMMIYVIRDLDDLNQRINDRVKTMMQHGWIEETKKLIESSWQGFIRKKKLIGYTEIADFLQLSPTNRSETAYNKMVELIGNKTRQYAKRQRTFWRKIERELKQQSDYNGIYRGSVESLNLTTTHLQLYINELLKRVFYMGKKNE